MKSKFYQLVIRIRDTQVEEIDCSTCLDQISQYVDLQLDRGDAAERMPQVKQHLDQCGVCFEEYQVLLNFARLERDSILPSKSELAGQLKKPGENPT